MSPDWSLFNSYSSEKVTHRVQTAGGGTLPVKGVGTVPVNPLVVLEDVLYVEDLRANLISIKKLVDAYDWQLILDRDDYFLNDKVSRTKISSFRREGGMLLLEASPLQCLVSRWEYSKEERLIRLHQQMGHPLFDFLKSCYPLLFNGVVSKQLSCEACNMAKL